jgi:polysaccharide export outer membrane protein
MKLYVVMCGLAVAGCASPRMAENGPITVVSSEALPPPTTQDLSAGLRPHLLGPGDRITVEVFGLGDLSRAVQVDSSGQIQLPLAGAIDVAGKTPSDLAAMVEERLRAGYVRDPRVTVTLTEAVSQVVTVDGEVRMPGVYPVRGEMTLMRAIARAQGNNEFAQTSHVVVFRTVENRPMAALYDLRAIRLGAYQDPQIYPNDVVVVGESAARRIFPTAVQGVGLLMAPLITLLDNN